MNDLLLEKLMRKMLIVSVTFSESIIYKIKSFLIDMLSLAQVLRYYPEEKPASKNKHDAFHTLESIFLPMLQSQWQFASISDPVSRQSLGPGPGDCIPGLHSTHLLAAEQSTCTHPGIRTVYKQSFSLNTASQPACLQFSFNHIFISGSVKYRLVMIWKASVYPSD